MIRQRLRFRPGVLLAYLIAGGLGHIISQLLDVNLAAQIIHTGLLCFVVQTVYGREWWR